MTKATETTGPHTARLIAERRAEIDAATDIASLSALVDFWARVVATGVARGERVAPANVDPYVYADSRLTAMADRVLERDPETHDSDSEETER